MRNLMLIALFWALPFLAFGQEAAPAPAAPAPAPAAPSAPAPAAPAPAAAPAAPAAKGPSLMEELGKGGKEPPKGADPDPSPAADTPEAKAIAAAEKDTRRPKDIPAKWWDAEKGEIRTSAAIKSATELEARMRTVGLPPKDAAEYKFEVPEGLKATGFEFDPARHKAFREAAHGLGLTQKQYEGVMGLYLAEIPALGDQVGQFSAAKARTELLSYYKTEEVMTEHVRDAYQAFMAYADEKDQELIDQIGNIPAVVRVLAKVRRDMKEDPGVNPDAILDADSLDTLMRGAPGKEDSPYWNAEDPRHTSVKAKVAAHHAAKVAAQMRKAA